VSWKTVSTYYARKPLRAEHPIGSGTIVEYQPGDVIPAGEWGRSASALVENGRAVEMMDNVWVDDGEGEAPTSLPPRAFAPAVRSQEGPVIDRSGLYDKEPENPNVDKDAPVEEGVTYPLHEGAGWYQLSNGEKVRGKDDATAAEAALGGTDE